MQLMSSISVSIIVEVTGFTCDYEIITVKSGMYVLSCCYRPPNGNLSSFLMFIETLFDYVQFNRYRLVLSGDINVDISVLNNDQNELLSLIESIRFPVTRLLGGAPAFPYVLCVYPPLVLYFRTLLVLTLKVRLEGRR